jgi:hypothetical protein
MRKFKTQEELEQERQDILRYLPGAQQQLPIDKLILIYGRQSTTKQFFGNKESAQEQAVDLLDHALLLGWPDHLRLLFIENKLKDGTIKNASGRLRIDERPGLSEVVALIKTGTVGAVLVRAVDRLFRDETLVGPTMFADLCRQHHVLILTKDELYNFNHPGRGGDDYNAFILECMKAKDYIEKHIKGTMHKNRDRKALRGEFTGHAVPTGFMLDDNHLFYIPNPIWAPVMKNLLKRFKQLDANMAQFRREIVGYPVFPDLPEDIKKQVGRIQLTKVPGGYTVKSYDGLRMMVTNVALIGHIAYNGRIVKENAHEAIVDEADFWFCFNHLSPTTIDGTPIPSSKIRRYNSHSNTALLQGKRKNGDAVITSTHGFVYVVPHGKNVDYVIRDKDRIQVNKDVACIRLETLDHIFLDRLLARLNTFRETHQAFLTKQGEIKGELATGAVLAYMMYQHAQADGATAEDVPSYLLQSMQTEEDVSLVSIPEALAVAKAKHVKLQREYDLTFDLMSDKEVRDNKEQRLKLTKDISDMEAKLEEEAASAQDIQDIGILLDDAYTVWPTLTLEKQRRFIRAATTSIRLDMLATGWLQLTINWSPFLCYDVFDVCYIWQQGGAGKTWTDEEETILKAMYATAERNDILHALPTRSWTSISAHAYLFGLKRQVQRWSFDLPRVVSVEDQRIMETYDLDAGQNITWKLFKKRFEWCP